MLSKKILLICMSMFLCTTSFSHATEYRKMDRQNRKMMAKKQRLEDKRVTKQFQFRKRFNFSSLQGQLILSLLVMSSVFRDVEALDTKPPSTRAHSNHLSAHDNLKSYCPAATNTRRESTKSGLSSIFCHSAKPCVAVLDADVIFSGSGQEVDSIIEKFGDFDSLREKVIPTSPKAAKTIAHSGLKFSNWPEVEKSIGINRGTLNNMAYLDDPEKRIIAINYEKSETRGKSFNQRMADSYLETLKAESEFFRFISNANKGVVTYVDDKMIIHYNLLDEYFSHLDLKKMPGSKGESSITIPLDSVLKRLIAAVSGQVSLEESRIPGEYHVRSVNVGSINSPDEGQSSFPMVEIIIDTSSSMFGKPIDTVNRILPKILSGLQNELKKEERVAVNIHSLSDRFYLSQSFDLDKDSTPTFLDMHSSGGTDLTPIGRRLKIQEGENPHKVVVAFTDGEHNALSKLDQSYYNSLRDLQKSGKFAQPYLCKVGTGSDAFFKDVAEIFSGSYSKEHSTKDCWERVLECIPHLLESKSPLILTVSGNNEVIWLGMSGDKIQTTPQTVHAKDEIVFGNYNAIVTPPIPDETREGRRARLLKALAELDEGL